MTSADAVPPADGVTATFRFYEELNDFLPPARRKQEFGVRCARAATAKHMIEALGVPHTEVEVVLVNGESVGFERVLRDGDRVAVYPKFEALDVRPLLRVREAPLRTTRFLADAHLGGLARLLRLVGFDTRYVLASGVPRFAAPCVIATRSVSEAKSFGSPRLRFGLRWNRD